MNKKILCVESSDKTEIEALYNQLQSQASCRVLECNQKNLEDRVLLAESTDFSTTYKDFIIEEPHPDLLNSYFKLSSPTIQKNLCILESSSLLQLLRASNCLMKNHGYQGIEIYRATGGVPRAIALLCNGSLEFSLPKNCRDVQYKIVGKINPFILKEFF